MDHGATESRKRPLTRSVFAVALSLALAILVFEYAIKPLLPLTTAAWAGAFAAILAMTGLSIWWLNRRYAAAIDGCLQSRRDAEWLIAALVIGVLLVIAIPFSLPEDLRRHSLAIVVDGTTGRQIEVLGVCSAWKVPVGESSQYRLEGDWQRRNGRFIHSGSAPARLCWQGWLKSDGVLRFAADADAGEVTVVWDGESQVVDLSGERPMVYEVPLPIRQDMWVRAEDLATRLAQVVLLATFVFFVGYWLVMRIGPGQLDSDDTSLQPTLTPNPSPTGQPRYSPRGCPWERGALHPPGRWAWFGYALPCLIVWTYYLWVFWPGVIHIDGLVQWRQVQAGQFDDAHPAFHTMLLWLLSHAWNSPAAAIVVQIPLLAATVGWLIASLRRAGLSRGWAAGVCAALALSPANGTMAVQVLKDTPYGIAFLWLSGCIFNVVATRGRWLEGRLAWLLLTTSAALVALLRHNGPPVALLALLPLPFVFRGQWRPAVSSMVAVVLAVVAVKGLLFSAVGVAPAAGFYRVLPLLHHIAAHTAHGTPLTDDERQLLEKLHPLDHGEWPYHPASVDRLIWWTGKFDHEEASRQAGEIAALAARLASRRPEVDLTHLARNSTMMGRMRRTGDEPYTTWYADVRNGQMYTGRADTPLSVGPFGEPDWQPVGGWLPRVLLVAMGDQLSWLVWRPALFFYLLVAGAVVAALRSCRTAWLLVALPAIAQTLLFVLVCPEPCFRYQWPVFITAVTFAPYLLFAVPRCDPL